MPSNNNELYLVVLPLIHLSSGLVEQTLTLMPSRDFATEFFENEVDDYVLMFTSRANKYLTGGHVTAYAVNKEKTEDGRFIVRVTQSVS
jgi:hypothetical protein